MSRVPICRPRLKGALVLKGRDSAAPAVTRGNRSPSMLRRLYDWTLSLAGRPVAPWALALVAFAESSFFPVPPDAMLVPMVLARPDRVWRTALIATVASVLGGLLGYAIGALLYDSLGGWLFNLYGLHEGADKFRDAYVRYGHWIILIKGLTPIPYKLVTIASGFAGYDLFWFTVLSIITRGVRFFVLAGLVARYGPAVQGALERNLNLAAAGLVGAIVVGFVAFRYLL